MNIHGRYSMKIAQFIKDKKGASGIGTLIVFIAMVLVAAVAASVLINTSGFLQQKASSTGKESTEQVASGLMTSGVTGHIYKYGTTYYDLDKMVAYILPNAGSAPIDLKEAKLFLTYDGKSVVLNYSGKLDATAGETDVFKLTNAFAINYSNVSHPVTTTVIKDNTTNDGSTSDTIEISTTNPKLKAILKGLSVGDKVTVLSNNTITSENITTVYSRSYDGTTFTIVMNFTSTNIVTADKTLGTSDWVKLNGTTVWGGADDSSFLVVALQDADKSVVQNAVINKGDLVAILINSEAALGKEIPERKGVSGKLQPEFGAPAVMEFTTPVAYTQEIMELQ
jgi:flagellin FlaB